MAIKVQDQSEEIKEQQEVFDLVRSLLGGTKAMRKAGEKYMPKRTVEDSGDYSARLRVATLYPAFKETIAKMTGRAFADQMVVNDDVPEWIGDTEEGCIADFDQQGRSIHVFCRDVFSTALSYGLTHVMVDTPIGVKADGSAVRTVKDAKEAGIRPYAIHIHPTRVLGWQENKGVLTQLRISGSRVAQDGEFGQVNVPQVWVYDLMVFEDSTMQVRKTAYEKSEQSGDWVAAGTPVMMGINRIPFITFYTKRTGFMEAEPPLLELAYLNVKHWNKQSDSDELIKVASVPILVEYGGGETTQITIGARHAVKMPQDASLEYCEHTGAAIKAGRDDLDSLKEEMRDSGAKLLQPGPTLTNAKTATQVNEEAAADNSILGAIVRDFEAFLKQVLQLFIDWNGTDEAPGTLELQTNLDPDMSPIDALKLLLDMCNSGRLSGRTLFEESKKRGILPEDLEWDEEQSRIKEETPDTTMVNIDPATGLPLKKPAPPSPNPTIPNAGDA
jgi:hypothetical protein